MVNIEVLMKEIEGSTEVFWKLVGLEGLNSRKLIVYLMIKALEEICADSL